MLLFIDNYDSFSYNLVQVFGGIYKQLYEDNIIKNEVEIKVVRNDELTLEEIEALQPEAIILSPGPGRPKDAGICEELIKNLQNKFKILGVCLGHQAICEANGATIDYAKQLMHGKQSTMICEEDPIFDGLEKEIVVGRYHSLAVVENTLNENLKVLATTKDGEVMAVKHTKYPVYGLQFHPESVLTKDGAKILFNFICQDGRKG